VSCLSILSIKKRFRLEGIGNCDVNKLIGDKSLEWFIGNDSQFVPP